MTGDVTTQTSGPGRSPLLTLRVLPPRLFAGRPGVLVERSLLVHHRGWLTVVAGFCEPAFYLAAFGLGFGALVATVAGPDGRPTSYLAFVAPALLACSAMNGALFDAVYNVFHKLRFTRLYESMLATSLGPTDVAVGEISWAVARGTLYSGAFMLVMLVTGVLDSLWGLLALPAATLVSLAFAAAGMAATTFMRTYRDFELVNLAVLPMFFFSTTFYPLTIYPEALRPVVQGLPLYQAVALLRELSLGQVGWETLGHVGYLLAMAAISVLVTARRLESMILR